MIEYRGLDEIVSLVTERLQAPRIYTATYAELGGIVVAKLRNKAKDDWYWDARSFDSEIEDFKRSFEATGKLRAVAHPDDWVRSYFFVKLCKEIGIQDSEKVPYGKVLSPIFGAAFTLDKQKIKVRINSGWEDWLRETIPLQYTTRPMPKDELVESIALNRLYLWDEMLNDL